MSEIANFTGFCFFCYKTLKSPNTTVQTIDNITKFIRIVKQFADQNPGKYLYDFFDDKLIECCKKCNVIVESFFKGYTEFKILEIKLDFMLENLAEKIDHANKVPARWVHVNRVLEELFRTDSEKKSQSQEKIRKLRQNVAEAGRQRRIRSQPRVSLERNLTSVKSCVIRDKMLDTIQSLKILNNQNNLTQKKWRCKFCQKRFSSKHNLSVHLRVHTGEKPFKCRFCKKDFRFRGDFARHLTDNHGNEKGVEKELKRKWAIKPVSDDMLIEDGSVIPKSKVQCIALQKLKCSTKIKKAAKYSDPGMADEMENSLSDDNIIISTFPDHDDENDYASEMEDHSSDGMDDTMTESEANYDNENPSPIDVGNMDSTARFQDPLIQVKIEHQLVGQDGFTVEHLSIISNEELSSVDKSSGRNLEKEIDDLASSQVNVLNKAVAKQTQNRYGLRKNRAIRFTEVESDDDEDLKDIAYKSEGPPSESDVPPSDDEEYQTKGQLKRERLKFISSTKLDIECKICGRRFNSLITKDRHFKCSHDLKQSKTKRYYPCKKNGCTDYFLTSEQAKKHRRFDHSKTGRVGKTEKGRPFKCPKCDKRFALNGTLTKHLEYHKDPSEWKYECKLCKKKFAAKFHFEYHLRLHTNDRPYKCQFCDERFTRSDKLNIHVAKEHRNEDFNKDEVANEAIIKEGEIKCASSADRSVIMGARPLVVECQVCKRKFTGFLKKELHFKNFHDLSRISDKSKVERCNAIGCGAYFLQNVQLKAHKSLEHGLGELYKKKKKFKCETCEKAFVNRHHLKIHSEYHKDPSEWKFECGTCGKKCVSEGKLRDHIRTHTKEKPFQCQFCVEKFGSSSNLKGHLKKWHKDEEGIRDELNGKEKVVKLKNGKIDEVKEKDLRVKYAKIKNAKIFDAKVKDIKVKVINTERHAEDLKKIGVFAEEVESLSSENILSDNNIKTVTDIDLNFGKVNRLNGSVKTNVLTKKGDCFGDGTLVEFEDLD